MNKCKTINYKFVFPKIFLYFLILLRKFMRKFTLIFLYLITVVLITSCGSSIDSTDNRYKRATVAATVPQTKPASTLIEDFDFTPFFLELKDEKTKRIGMVSNDDELWWNYTQRDLLQKVTIRKPGYRVQVLATDDLDEAQQMRSDVYFRTNKNEIYVTYQPPLYKVKVGDYETPSGANNLAFKLNQLGFSTTQVVADTVNIQK